MLRQLQHLHPLQPSIALQLIQLPQLGYYRHFAQWRGTQRIEGNLEKKRRRRTENARLRDWAAREDQISWVADRHEETLKPSGAADSAGDDKRWNAWRRMHSVYSSRRNGNKGWAKFRKRARFNESSGSNASATFDDDWMQRNWFEDEQTRRLRQAALKQAQAAAMAAEAQRTFDGMSGSFGSWRQHFSSGWKDNWQGSWRGGPYPRAGASQHGAPLHSASVTAYLGVLRMPPNDRFDAAALKAAFHSRCKLCHPDLNPGAGKQAAEAQFKAVKDAYDALMAILKAVPIRS